MKKYLRLAALAVSFLTLAFVSSGCAGPERKPPQTVWVPPTIVINNSVTTTATPQPVAKPLPDTVGQPMRILQPGEQLHPCETNKPAAPAATPPPPPQPMVTNNSYFGNGLVVQGALQFPYYTPPPTQVIVVEMPVGFYLADNDPGGYWVNIPFAEGESGIYQRRFWVPYRGTLEHQVSPDRSWGGGYVGRIY